MADRQKMSVDEILAACRKADAEGGAAQSAPAPKKSQPEAPIKAELAPAKQPEPAAEETPAETPAPAPKPKAAPAKSPGGMSVADMMAAARASAGGAKAAPKESPAAEPKATPRPKAASSEAKASPKAPAAEKKAGGPRDTQSILAAARKVDKPGPITKAEAAAKAVPVKEETAKKRLEVPPMPEKPAYAKPMPARARAADDEESRRGFLGIFLGSFLAVGFTSLGLTNLLYVLGFARFMFPNILTEPPTSFKVGPAANFAPGMVETKFVAQFNVWVVNTIYQGQQIIFALKTVCTHLGCTPNWLEAEQKFKCPCHGSGFYKDGVNFEGPAPRPLERHAIRVADDGQLQIDKSRIFQEEKGQWKDPSSFVPV